MSQAQERRDFWRAPFHSPACLVDADGVARAGRLHDLSLKGALLEMPDDWHGQPGERHRLQLELAPEVTIAMQTTVMHRHGCQVGLRCDEIDLDSVTALRRLVELNADDPALLERELAALVQRS
ncbi:Type IV pilus assembly PilZ [Sterolibacterium denitrificans]|uniref:Type IV pilus assembly PilZ n=2 Tax=Sterolibacterium denitrificans TaxID=157592 RepID=A0A7Z7MUJ1_9PROT|nr:PilZ domain-containing protein [Sterolibacterium denitrificans]KYC28936.1 hypothetical protein ACY05_03535 [Sterolibacterium denitrificans]SMB23252.1 Type IV pilus assembly PilZ [Sterolibacterium denitrificans]